jgi:adenylyl-sulfate kinase
MNPNKTTLPTCILLTGYSGSGKTTIADAFSNQLSNQGIINYVLDGDRIRSTLNYDLGFTKQDRSENLRRISEIALMMLEAGVTVIISVIAPYQEDRDKIKKLVTHFRYIEVFLDTSIECCINRDPKSLYKKTHDGILTNFTGIDSPYEPPTNPDIRLNTEIISIENCCNILYEHYKKFNKIDTQH